MIETVGTCGYGKELGKYGFPSNLCASNEICTEWLNFCKKNNMKWLTNSYGTLVHEDFNNHFQKIEKERNIMECLNLNYSNLKHPNVLKSTINDCCIITSSPNYYLDWFAKIEKYPYQIFIIHPSLLEDYNLNGINIAYCNMTYNEMYEINKAIYKDIGIYGAFRLFSGSYKEVKK